jgi:hypothetical protein
MSVIFVTNNSDKVWKDGYAGKFYTFGKGETVEIPIEVATHVFGYGDDNKEPYLARLGWITTANDLDKGLELLSKWELSTEPPKKNQSLSPLVERVPLEVVKSRGGKVLSAA